MMKSLIIILAFFAITGAIKAQTNCACCNETQKQFDFWVGEWIVLDSLGNKVGENQISKIEENCIVLEHWTGAKGGTGTSHNYYNKTDSTWNQLWIDNKGNVLKLKGQLESGKMVLKSDPDASGVKGKKMIRLLIKLPGPKMKMGRFPNYGRPMTKMTSLSKLFF